MVHARPVRFVGILLGAASLCILLAWGTTVSADDPFHAPFIDNQKHTLAANSETWHRFEYGANGTTRSLVSLTMVNGNGRGVRFQVWAPERIGNWWENKPTGQGTVAMLDCETGQPTEGGECPSNDLTWVGSFISNGTFYVRVINDNPDAADYMLVIQGDGVSARPAASSASPFPTTGLPPATTPASTALAVAVDDPASAIPVDNQLHMLAPNTATWYRFEYSIAGEGPRRVVSLRIPGGATSGVRFEVWPGEYVAAWNERQPVGRGTREVLVNCRPTAPDVTPTVEEGEPTPTPEPTEAWSGHCVTSDLTWMGAFGATGSYYVRVINETASAQTFTLILH